MPPQSLTRFAPIALLACAAVGCGGTPEGVARPESIATFGPLGGPVAALPGGAAAEVTTEASGTLGRLVATFYASEAMDAPLSPGPTDVRIDLAMPGGESTSVALSPSRGPEAGVGARFASEPGDYAYDPLIGTLHATVGGASASVPFSGALN